MALSSPLVSVVMAVYNERPYLEKSIRSILNQEFRDFEFIIVDDGSTDGSTKIIKKLSYEDKRIRLIQQENKGLASSLNIGLSLASGKYVARMDGDDLSKPRRLGCQVHFLEEHPDVGVVGTKIEKIDAQGRVVDLGKRPTEPDLIAWNLIFNTSLCHPSVMIRCSVLEKLDGYAEWAHVGQDYELWTRAVQVSRVANMSDRLFKLRRHEGSVTTSKRVQQIRVVGEAASNFHESLLGSRADEEKSKFLAWMEIEGIERAMVETSVQDLRGMHAYLRDLYEVCVSQLLSDGRNIRVREAAIVKLDMIAEKIMGREGWERGMIEKMRGRCMSPVREILPWGLRAIQRRIA